jgi:DNA replication factor GINS
MYDEIYEMWKREKDTVELQGLPKNFYAKVAAYVKKLKEENRMLDRKSTKAKLLDRETKNVRIMVGELFRVRIKKFREKAVDQETVLRATLSAEEEKLCGEFLSMIETYQAFYKDVLRGHLPNIEEHRAQQSMIVLRFIQETPAFVGSDMVTYGPFKPEDIATLPPENARVLIKQGVVMEVDAKSVLGSDGK